MNKRYNEYIERAAEILLAKRKGILNKQQYTKKVFDLAQQYKDLFDRPDILEFAPKTTRAVDRRANELDSSDN